MSPRFRSQPVADRAGSPASYSTSPASSLRPRKNLAQLSSPHPDFRPSRRRSPSAHAPPPFAARLAPPALVGHAAQASLRSSRRPPSAHQAFQRRSPRWDRIGDDDSIFIQSDDTYLPWNSAQNPRSPSDPYGPSPSRRLVLPQRKRKRTTATTAPVETVSERHHASGATQSPEAWSAGPRPLPSRNSVQGRFSAPANPLEGCANCHTKTTSRWWKRNKRSVLPNGRKSVGVEILCNPCSIHWNQNGYHRQVEPKPCRSTSAVARPAASSSRARRSLTASAATVGLSSPTYAAVRSQPDARSQTLRRLGSPSPLTLVAERESQILQRSLTQACHKIEASRKQTLKAIHVEGIYEGDESEDSMNHHLAQPGPRQSRLDRGRSTSLTVPAPRARAAKTTRQRSLLGKSSKTNNRHDHLQAVMAIEARSDDELVTHELTDEDLIEQGPASLFQEAASSPPRTPPVRSHMRTGSTSNHELKRSPSREYELDKLLSPSFLNASPNSLLRKLNSQALGFDNFGGEAGKNSNMATCRDSKRTASASEKVFSPSRPHASSCTFRDDPPLAEPTKRPEISITPSKTGPPALNEAIFQSASSGNNSISSIFAVPQSIPGSRSRQKPSLGSKEDPAVAHMDPISKPRRSKRNSPGAVKLAQKDAFFGHAGVFEGIHSPLNHTNQSCRRTSHVSVPKSLTVSSPKRSKNQVARTIWSRRLESLGASSEDSHFEDLVAFRGSGQSPAGSGNSQDGLRAGRFAHNSGLTPAISQGLHSLLSGDAFLGHAENVGYPNMNLLPPSSPPLLPPPSDCSEGVTPHSGMLFSDGCEEQAEMELGKGSSSYAIDPNFQPGDTHYLSHGCADSSRHIDYDLPTENSERHDALVDITPSLNNQSSQGRRHHAHPLSSAAATGCSNEMRQMQMELEGLSPEIMSALSDAIKAGWSSDELARALRNINCRSVLFSHDLSSTGEGARGGLGGGAGVKAESDVGMPF